MARSNKKWNGFFNYTLSDSERSAIKENMGKSPSNKVGGWISSLSQHGYKVTVSYDSEDGIYTCACTGNQYSDNQGWTLVIQHVDMAVAVAASWFVADEVFQWGGWPTGSDTRPDINW